MHFLDIATYLGLDIIIEGLLPCCFYFAIAEVKSLWKHLFGKNAKYITQYWLNIPWVRSI